MSTTGLTMSGPKSTALTFYEHGVIKVIKVGVKIPGVAYVVETCGDPDPSKSVAATSLVDYWMCFNRFTEFLHLFSGEIYSLNLNLISLLLKYTSSTKIIQNHLLVCVFMIAETIKGSHVK
ncbi:hypothetical protein OROHE_017202 [Orobanche hederae]